MQYRKEIDGLRALAVLPVIFFHAGFPWFTGGFIGVDVFFVISGFLITSIILGEKQAGTFSLVRFYERRARRILPALFFIMVLCLPFAWLWMAPRDLQDFSKSLIAVSVFISNLFFWNESGYFDAAAELKPLLHTWSLAVEEQYYLLFPLFILLFWRSGLRCLFLLLIVGLLVSLGLAQFGGNFNFSAPHINPVWDMWHQTEWGFYFLPTRCWELLIGAGAAFFHCINTRKTTAHTTRELLGMMGVALIAYAIFAFDKTTPFPSIYTLIPTLGTLLVLLFATGETFVGKQLGRTYFVAVGLMSYSLYLWHYPLFVFARLRSLNNPEPGVFFALTVLAVVLAYFTWRYIERPFKDKQKFSRRTIFLSALVMSASMIGLGFTGYHHKGFPERFSPAVMAALEPEKTDEDTTCNWHPLDKNIPSLRGCEFGDLHAKKTFALYGDSHAQALFSALGEAFKTAGIKGLRIDDTSCGVIPKILMNSSQFTPNETSLAECLAAHDKLIGYVKRNTAGMVVAIRWTFQMYPIRHEVETLGYDNGEGGVEYIIPREYFTEHNGTFTTDGEGKKDAIRHLAATLLSLQKPVFLIYPIPESGWDIPRYNYQSYLRSGEIPARISTSYDNYKTRQRFVTAVLDGIGAHPNLIRIRPDVLLCNTYVPSRCVAQLDKTPLYYDDDHLSNAGARLVVDQIMKQLRM